MDRNNSAPYYLQKIMAKEDGRVNKRIRMRKKDIIAAKSDYLKPIVIKGMDEIGMEARKAFSESTSSADASGRVVDVFKANLNKYLDLIIEGPRETMIERVLQLKSQINGRKEKLN